jgi:hypothetical protein
MQVTPDACNLPIDEGSLAPPFIHLAERIRTARAVRYDGLDGCY